MGGHGGLNILPQKRWNVYRYDNREKVSRDEAKHSKRRQLQRYAERHEALDAKIKFLRSSKKKKSSSRSFSVERGHKKHGINSHVKLSSHINFFEKEEQQENERRQKPPEHYAMSEHETLEDLKANSPSHRFGRVEPAPWYMCARKDVFKQSDNSVSKISKSSFSLFRTLKTFQAPCLTLQEEKP